MENVIEWYSEFCDWIMDGYDYIEEEDEDD